MEIWKKMWVDVFSEHSVLFPDVSVKKTSQLLVLPNEWLQLQRVWPSDGRWIWTRWQWHIRRRHRQFFHDVDIWLSRWWRWLHSLLWWLTPRTSTWPLIQTLQPANWQSTSLLALTVGWPRALPIRIACCTALPQFLDGVLSVAPCLSVCLSVWLSRVFHLLEIGEF